MINGFRKAVLPAVVFLLNACGGSGGSDDQPKNIPPSASITASETSGLSPLKINLDASGSSDDDGTIASYAWDFGDGHTARGLSVEHTYDAGTDADLTYTVSLTITDDDGARASVTKTITALKNSNPIPAFSYSQPDPESRVIHFDGTASTDAESSELSYTWSFGDGSSADGAAPAHEYAGNGQYTVSLQVDDRTGRTALLEQVIVVSNGKFSISGMVQPASRQVADSDTNDPRSEYKDNNSLREAQLLPNPVDVTGYVTVFPTGGGVNGDDRFAQSIDEFDIYQLSLTEGQSVRLHIADWNAGVNDLDLILLDESGNLADYSWGIEEYEELTITSSATYYLAVNAFWGRSSYHLSVFDSPQVMVPAIRNSMTSRDEFVMDEVLGRFKTSVAASAQAKLRSAGMLMSAGRANGPARIKAGPLAVSALADGGKKAFSSARELMQKIQGGKATSEQLQKLETIISVKNLRQTGYFEYVELNRVRRRTSTNDPNYPSLWHYDQIGVPSAWSGSIGSGVTVAVIDTGIVSQHEDLMGQLVPGYDFVSDPVWALDGDGIDNDPEDPGDDPYGTGDSWHGTHVAGTIAAVADNGLGIVGASYGARVMPIRVLGLGGGGTDYDIVQGIYYAAGLTNDSGTLPQQRADVINMSLGGFGYSQAQQDAVLAARAQGVIVVAAAGNSSDTADNYSPAGLDGVITVAAVSRDGQPAYYTNYGATVELMAPGGVGGPLGDGGVLSTVGVENGDGSVGSGYAGYQGTSMAAPHISAVIALMKEVAPAMTPDQLDQLIADFDVSSASGSRDPRWGYGLINAELAVDAASRLSGQEPTGRLYFERGILLNLGSRGAGEVTLGASQLYLSVAGSVAVSPWLSANYLDGAASGLGRYRVAVDSEQLATGHHLGLLTFNASNGTAIDLYVSVTVIQQDYLPGSYVGAIYVAFHDSETGQQLDGMMALYDPEADAYSFESSPLDAKNAYFVIAGSDEDNDYEICEDDEFCGTFEASGAPAAVVAGEFDTDAVGLDLAISVNKVSAATTLLQRDQGVAVYRSKVEKSQSAKVLGDVDD